MDELSKVGLTAVPSIEVRPVRVLESPIHFECKYHKTILLPGNTPQAVHYVIIGKVIGIHIKDEFITKEGLVDTVNCITKKQKYNSGLLFKEQNSKCIFDTISLFEDKKLWKQFSPEEINHWSKNFSKEKFEINFQNFLHESIETFAKKNVN